MFIAVDSNGQRISIEDASKENKFYCPICGEELTIRATESTEIRTHFAHKRGTVCYDDWSHDMSEWHLSWQRAFPAECREVVIEKNGVKHRADVFINNTVIEFQHSPIKAEEIAKRNEFYLSCGYQVVWVFDATNQIKNWLDGSIDPMQCRNDDLCWKREKPQFRITMPPQVRIFLQYKTTVSVKEYPNQEFDILLLIAKMGSKHFTFFQTVPSYILPINFVKEYGVVANSEVLSISEIINQTNAFIRAERDRQRTAQMRQVNRIFVANRPRRRWHL